jgi:hypothetical protein
VGRIQLTHEVSHQFLAAEDLDHFHAIPYVIYVGQSSTGTSGNFSLSCQPHSTNIIKSLFVQVHKLYFLGNIYIYIYVYIYTLLFYIRHSPTCFGSEPSLWSYNSRDYT